MSTCFFSVSQLTFDLDLINNEYITVLNKMRIDQLKQSVNYEIIDYYEIERKRLDQEMNLFLKMNMKFYDNPVSDIFTCIV